MFRIAQEVRDLIRPGDRVLDIGGAEEIFPRANAVMDIVPYAERRPGPLAAKEKEQFTEADWFVGDVCAPEVWQRFSDKQFDFVLCSHTLEDIRDPIFVCAQMIRVAKRGYIETPSRIRECTRAESEEPLAGWPHHRWLVDVEDGSLIFTAKMHWANDFDYAGARRHQCLSDYRFQFVGLEWEGSFGYQERMAKGPVIESENLFHYFAHFPWREPPGPVFRARDVVNTDSTFRGHREFLLAVERGEDPETTLERYRRRKAGAAKSGKSALRFW